MVCPSFQLSLVSLEYSIRYSIKLWRLAHLSLVLDLGMTNAKTLAESSEALPLKDVAFSPVPLLLLLPWSYKSPSCDSVLWIPGHDQSFGERKHGDDAIHVLLLGLAGQRVGRDFFLLLILARQRGGTGGVTM